MAWPFSAGAILTATDLNDCTRANDAICQLSQSATQSLNDNTATTLSYDTEDFDPLGWHAGGNPTRITPTIAGRYLVYSQLSVASATDYFRVFAQLFKNGAAVSSTPTYSNEEWYGNPGVSVTPNISSAFLPVSMNGTTDYFEIVALQDNNTGAARVSRSLFTVVLDCPA